MKRFLWILAGTFAIFWGAFLTSPVQAKAQVEVSNSNELRSAIENKEKEVEVILTKDITIQKDGNNKTVDITSGVVIDLNGYKLTQGSSFYNEDASLFSVSDKGTLTLTNRAYKTKESILSGGSGDDFEHGTKSCLIGSLGKVQLKHITIRNIYNKCSYDAVGDKKNTSLCVINKGSLEMEDCEIKNIKTTCGYLISGNTNISDYSKNKNLTFSFKNIRVGSNKWPVYGGLYSGEKVKASLEDVEITASKASVYIRKNPKSEIATQCNTGGFKVKSGSSVTVKGTCILQGIESFNNGGPIKISQSSEGKSANLTVEKGAKLIIEGCTSLGGYYSGKGGGILVGEGGSFTNNGSVLIQTNKTASSSGGISIADGGQVIQNGELTIQKNEISSDGHGQAIDVQGTLSLLKGSITSLKGTLEARDILRVSGKLKVDGEVAKFQVIDENQDKNCIRIENEGSAKILKGQISGGRNGIYNDGTVQIKDVTIKNHEKYGIYQNGTCLISGDFLCKNTIFLEEKRYLILEDALNQNANMKSAYQEVLSLTTAKTDRNLGRVMMVIKSEESKISQNDIAQMVERGLASYKVSGYCLRAGRGKDQNGSVGQVLLSKKYKITYKGLNGLKDGYSITQDLVGKEEIAYWKENYCCNFETPTLYKEETDHSLVKSQAYKFIGWSQKKNPDIETDKEIIFTKAQTILPTADITWYGIWKQAPLVKYQGNYGKLSSDRSFTGVKREDLVDDTKGEALYQLVENKGLDGTKPWFYKEVTSAKGQEKYSFVGWSFDKNATYDQLSLTNEKGIYLPLEKIKLEQIIRYAKATDAIETKDDKDYLLLKAIYDAYPVFTKYEDITVLDEDLEQISEEQLLEDIIVSDLEDGRLQGQSHLWVEDFENIKEEMKQFQETGAVDITLTAQDGYGNKTSQQVTLWVIKSQGSGQSEYYTRYINEDAYKTNQKADYSETNEQKYGGLLVNSIWYKNASYKQVIEQAFENLNNNSFVQCWEFDAKEVKRVKEFVHQYGYGKLKDSQAIKKFMDLFATRINLAKSSD